MHSKQKIASKFAAISFAMAVAACVHQPVTDGALARAPLIDAKGQDSGTVSIVGMPGKLTMRIDAKGVPAGKHGIHLHQVGRCDAPAFDSAGPHWNPAGRKHGLRNSNGPHAGDFPNIEADAAGTIMTSIPLDTLELTGGSQPLLDADGAAVVIHAQADDNISDPSGNSGARILCGIVKLVG